MGGPQRFSGISFSFVLKCKGGSRLSPSTTHPHGMHRPCESPPKSTASGELAPRSGLQEIGLVRSEALPWGHGAAGRREPLGRCLRNAAF